MKHICIVIFIFLLISEIGFPAAVEGNSMQPAIRENKIVYVFTIVYGIRIPFSTRFIVRWGVPKEGSIVAFIDPMGNFSIKRCITRYKKEIYLEGDNKISSVDSRNYGYIPIENIIGNVLTFSD
ncbi:S26 family signal peptidase [Spirochaetia bacterium 38H-sp]|uniref:S26 family signal peptidase n=1 Tax=Rarispira pelagica TaxID=3141764 RepID=A0ABU9UD37_9SPIR